MSEFKVGDKVVYTDIQGSCVLTYDGQDEGALKLHWLSYPDGTTGYIFSLDKIRKAEPEEIAAGHRIDCETLDKPENHISPNCKSRDV
jgi:hypothetical protein